MSVKGDGEDQVEKPLPQHGSLSGKDASRSIEDRIVAYRRFAK